MLARLAGKLIRLYGYPQEYMCCAPETLDGKVAWSVDGRPVDPRDVVLLGYRPLVLVIAGLSADRPHALELRIGQRSIAGMTLSSLFKGNDAFSSLFRGTDPWQRFLPLWKNALDRGRQQLNQRRASNVTQGMDDYDLLRIAYAQPRAISLAVVGPPEAGNIFPTDLNGPSGDDHFLSLRTAGKACAQVQQQGRALLCRMPLDQARAVYALGRRHMADPGPLQNVLPWDGTFAGHAVPSEALSVVQLEVVDQVDIGIHRVFRCRRSGECIIWTGQALAHVHVAVLAALGKNGRAVPVRVH